VNLVLAAWQGQRLGDWLRDIETNERRHDGPSPPGCATTSPPSPPDSHRLQLRSGRRHTVNRSKTIKR